MLVDGPSRRDHSVLAGRCRANRMVHFRGAADRVGRIVPVRIRDATALSLTGEIVTAA
jgi:tRNA-2-methylthio-N6-dimethylallyladenosine synthase